MDTYTFIAEYKGGTYVSQIQGKSISEACTNWGLFVSQNDNIPIKNKTSFSETMESDFEDSPPVCLDDTPNVWYFMADAGKGYIHVNVVKTHPILTDWNPRPDGALSTDGAPGAAAIG